MNVVVLQNHKSFIGSILSCLVITFFLGASVSAESLEKLSDRAPSPQTSVVVRDLNNNVDLFSKSGNVPLKPASVLKLLATYGILKRYGGDYTFQTNFRFLNSKGKNTLFLVGGGDPGFTTEDAYAVARELILRGVNNIETLSIDNSLFEESPTRVGGRAYEAAPSAFMFNYNSIAVVGCPSLDGREALVSVSPIEAGIALSNKVKVGRETQLAISEVSDTGDVSVSGTLNPHDGCSTVYRSMPRPAEYAAHVFAKILKSFNVKGSLQISTEKAPREAELIYSHKSKPLSFILNGMNHFSTNVIAEDLLYALGGDEQTVSRERGIGALSKILDSFGIPTQEYHLEDGSGLSHANRITGHALMVVFERALRDSTVAPEFESSLSVGGISGTLKRRDFGSSEIHFRGKTGSLDGVSSLVGVMNSKSGKRVAVVSLINGVSDKETAVEWEDKLVKSIYESY